MASLDSCLLQHPQHSICKSLKENTDFFPKRLIELLYDGRWKLTEWDTTASSPGEYLILSHCWGSELTQQVCLTAATEAGSLIVKPVLMLPDTYHDAIDIAQSLGYKYLWIDSLCIIQGDSKDWEEQPSLMGLIYKHASCNIAATWAKDGPQRCFNDGRDPATLAPTSIILPSLQTMRRAESYVMLHLGGTGPTKSIMHPLTIGHWFCKSGIWRKCSLTSLQTRCFGSAPNSLLVSSTPAVCTKSRSGGGDTFKGASVKPQLSHRRIQTLRRVWGDVVQKCSSSELSFSRDEPIAVAGIAQELRTRLDDIYLAGLWRKDIHKQLCWRWKHCEDHVGANNRADQKPAPTWVLAQR